MNIAILEAGRPPLPLVARFGRYPAMIERLLRIETTHYDVEAGAFPETPDRHQAYIITGSPAGVYEDHDWLSKLEAFLRLAAGRSRLVGICFGHQMMARALGGHVEKSGKGWGIGLHTYPIVRHEEWMGDPVPIISVPASHQDQIVLQPPRTEVIASSVFTPYAALSWTDLPAISFQFHPEFSPEYAAALIEHRRDRLPMADSAIASLDQPNDNDRVGGWIRNFLTA